MNQKRSESFIKKVDTNTELLISRFTNIIGLSASTSSQEVQASEMLQIELHAQTMVRLIEELLSVSRTLKESWILGQLPESKDVKDPTIGITEKINNVLDKVLNSEKFEEEVEIDEEEVEIDEDEEIVDETEEVKEEPKQEVKDEVKKEETVKDEVTEDTEVKEEPKDVQVKEEKEETNGINEHNNENVNIPNDDVIDISDNPNFDELDFESFGNMDQNNDDNNDIIMID
ncbi:hypothetical protein WICANDRAFT_60501 [Wickerhamomyces anomalus NRRL Y-366-8]|uniref:Mediator complex subunit 22 n=1 Tax=Wickerhamomyces anomalus (strain ATCC 58044 / CBS 1984 / NCYC 433 / NRRL Y-366-8) TaxID=683960 RepID=A0A1E3PAK7_WICAA|nr:uncharacterized protein WICANDRAFT_60501 [Wickerhamomyces anomalus NRRL Y-366-8]ODQ62443.1 hypothetical protein WICANDRAFT_60501 [Wickerhamomyces anomalus NRRL Y-366-8]